MRKTLSLVLLLITLTTLLVACAHGSGEKEEAKQYLVNDKEYQLAKFCIYASHGGLRSMLKRFENEQVRTLLYGCKEEGFLTATAGTVEFLKDKSKAEHNRLGKIFEENNIWYYTEDEGRQSAGINLLNASNQAVSSVVLGFAPVECEEADSWETVMRVVLQSPLSGGQQTVLTWDMPEDIKLANGCLDVLAAG